MRLLAAGAATVLLIGSLFTLWSYATLKAHTRCLAAGYARSTVDAKLRGYCLTAQTAMPVDLAPPIE